jgi:dolichyl-diphosphooligosaccharide--protein glycosyltransferase
VALLSGYVTDGLLASGRKTAWVTGAYFLILVLTPNLYAAMNSDQFTGIPSDWKETLDWMRTYTPEPFGDPGFYYARYSRQQFGPAYQYPQGAYSVMAWWDYGHWITNVARRIPVTNPTLTNAGAAADFFLAQSEREAISLLQVWRTRYVVVDERLPLWLVERDMVAGDYLAFFQNSRTHSRDEYLLMAYDSNTQGKLVPRLFYRPAYYRSMAIRLFVFGGQAVAGQGGATIVFMEQKPGSRQDTYPKIVRMQHFESQQEALRAEAACQNDGCALVGDDPTKTCVPVDALRRFRPVYSSTRATLAFGNEWRKAVQVYEVTETPK